GGAQPGRSRPRPARARLLARAPRRGLRRARAPREADQLLVQLEPDAVVAVDVRRGQEARVAVEEGGLCGFEPVAVAHEARPRRGERLEPGERRRVMGAQAGEDARVVAGVGVVVREGLGAVAPAQLPVGRDRLEDEVELDEAVELALRAPGAEARALLGEE